LVGFYDKAKVQEFIKKNHIQNNASIIHTYYKGKDWYVAIYGDYVNRDKAHQAVKQLPGPLSKSTPWIRTIASVQQAMKEQKPNAKQTT